MCLCLYVNAVVLNTLMVVPYTHYVQLHITWYLVYPLWAYLPWHMLIKCAKHYLIWNQLSKVNKAVHSSLHNTLYNQCSYLYQYDGLVLFLLYVLLSLKDIYNQSGGLINPTYLSFFKTNTCSASHYVYPLYLLYTTALFQRGCYE